MYSKSYSVTQVILYGKFLKHMYRQSKNNAFSIQTYSRRGFLFLEINASSANFQKREASSRISLNRKGVIIMYCAHLELWYVCEPIMRSSHYRFKFLTEENGKINGRTVAKLSVSQLIDYIFHFCIYSIRFQRILFASLFKRNTVGTKRFMNVYLKELS